MILLLPFYCPNCKDLTFLTQDEDHQWVEPSTQGWKQHGCLKIQGTPLKDSDLLKKLMSIPQGEGFAFRHRPGGYRGHGAPSTAVVLRLADESRSFFQVITPDNGLFEIKFSSAFGLVQGSLIQLKSPRRLATQQFRVDQWSLVESLELDSPSVPSDLYRLVLKAKEQEVLEALCSRLIQYFDRSGTPAMGILPVSIVKNPEQLYGRQIFVSPDTNLILALEKVNLPSQATYSIQQIHQSQVYEG